MSIDFQQESQNSLQTAMTTRVKETDAAEQVVEAKVRLKFLSPIEILQQDGYIRCY